MKEKYYNFKFTIQIISYLCLLNFVTLSQVSDSLLLNLSNSDASIRYNALNSSLINQIEDQKFVDLLINLLSDSDPYINGKAADILSEIGKNAVPSLIDALADSNSNVRRCAAISLSKMGNDAVDAQSVLIEALNDENENVRWCSLLALGNLTKQDDEVIQAIVRSMYDADYDVRLAASKILKRIAPFELRKSPPISDIISILDSLTPLSMDELNVPGVSIALVKEHRLVWSNSWGMSNNKINESVTNETIFEACSMSKPVFAYIVLKLIEEGKLDLDRPLYEYLDESCMMNQPYRKLITARMILSHTSGLPNWRKGEEERDGPLLIYFKPGTKFGYSGEGMFYLQRVIEKITGEQLDILADKMLFKPLGMNNSSFVWNKEIENKLAAGHDSEGNYLAKTKYLHANSAYSLYTSAEDYAKFILQIINTKESNNSSLSNNTIAEMLSRQVSADVRDPIDRPGRAIGYEVYYGLGWGINSTAKGDIIYHSGANRSGFRCYSQFDNEEGSGIVIMTNSLNGSALWSQLISKVGDL